VGGVDKTGAEVAFGFREIGQQSGEGALEDGAGMIGVEPVDELGTSPLSFLLILE